MISIEALEKHLFEFEMIRVIFRAPKICFVPDYPYKNQVSDTTNFSIFHERLKTQYPELAFTVIDGYGVTEHRLGKKIGDIRMSYLHDLPKVAA